MTPNLLDELEERLGELKSTLAVMAKYAPVPGILCAPTMEMGLGWKAKALLPKIEAAHATLVDMAKRMEALQSLAAAMYQAAGAYDMPVRFLDVLSAAGNGEPITEEQVDALLPCETPDTLQRLEAAERDAGKCWALHLKGPDDVVAAPSREAAEIVARNFNAFWDARKHLRDHDVHVVAEVIEWEYGVVDHAKSVAEHWPEYTDLLDATQEGEG